MATTLEVSYFNTFWVKRLKNFTQYQDRQSDGTIRRRKWWYYYRYT